MIPVLGVVIGSLAGVALVEWLQHRDLRRIFRVSRGFLMGWLLSTVVEVVGSVVLVALFVALAKR